MSSILVSRNITVNGRRTSVRLDPATWEALEEICGAEDVSLHAFCGAIDRERRDTPLTSAIRIAVLDYYRANAHPRAGLTVPGIRQAPFSDKTSRTGGIAPAHRRAGETGAPPGYPGVSACKRGMSQ